MEGGGLRGGKKQLTVGLDPGMGPWDGGDRPKKKGWWLCWLGWLGGKRSRDFFETASR